VQGYGYRADVTTGPQKEVIALLRRVNEFPSGFGTQQVIFRRDDLRIEPPVIEPVLAP